MFILFGILAGATIVIARFINGQLATEIGTLQSTFFNFVTGLLLSYLFLFFSKELFSLQEAASVPFWAYLGGIGGIFVIILCNYLIPRVSNFHLTLLIEIGQLITALIIDSLLFDSLSWTKIVGLTLVFIGISYNVYIDEKATTPQNTDEKNVVSA